MSPKGFENNHPKHRVSTLVLERIHTQNIITMKTYLIEKS